MDKTGVMWSSGPDRGLITDPHFTSLSFGNKTKPGYCDIYRSSLSCFSANSTCLVCPFCNHQTNLYPSQPSGCEVSLIVTACTSLWAQRQKSSQAKWFLQGVLYYYYLSIPLVLWGHFRIGTLGRNYFFPGFWYIIVRWKHTFTSTSRLLICC